MTFTVLEELPLKGTKEEIEKGRAHVHRYLAENIYEIRWLEGCPKQWAHLSPKPEKTAEMTPEQYERLLYIRHAHSCIHESMIAVLRTITHNRPMIAALAEDPRYMGVFVFLSLFYDSADVILAKAKLLLPHCQFIDGPTQKWRGIMECIKQYGLTRFLNKIQKDAGAHEHVYDLFNMLNQIKEKGEEFDATRLTNMSLKEAHDRVLKIYVELRDKPYKFKRRPILIEHQELVLRTPDTNTELSMWGLQLKHCVGSYAEAHANKSTTILGVFKAGTLIACVEVKNNKVVQCKGTHNSKVPEENTIVEALETPIYLNQL